MCKCANVKMCKCENEGMVFIHFPYLPFPIY
jgi:hypothetical protein